jgi:hypothetical protein
MAEDKKELNKKYAKLIARAWSDESFKKELLADPRTVLAAHGITVPEGVNIQVLEEKENVRYLILPAVPDGYPPAELDQRQAATMGLVDIGGCCN